MRPQQPRISLKRKVKCHHSSSTQYLKNYSSLEYNDFYQASSPTTHNQSQNVYINGIRQPQQQFDQDTKRVDYFAHRQIKSRFSTQQPQSITYKQPSSQVARQQINRIIAYNKKFFNEKIKLSTKPNQHRFRLPTKTGESVYKHQFPTKSESMGSLVRYSSQKDNKILNSTYDSSFKTSGPFLDITSYNQSFQKPNLQKQLKISVKNLPKSQSPRFFQTSYKNEYRNWGAKRISVDMCARPVSGNLLTGGKFLSRTSYRDDFKGQKVCLSKQNSKKNFPIFSDIRNPCSTTYSTSYKQKQGRVLMNYKPKQKYLGDGKLRLGSGSQYKRQFIKLGTSNQNSNNERSWRQLTVEQLQSMMLDL